MLTYKTLYNQPPATCTVCYQHLIIITLRNSSHQQHYIARTNIFYNSYFPSTLRLLNELSESLRNASIASLASMAPLLPANIRCSTNLLLYGHTDISLEINTLIFKNVYKYIKSTKHVDN